jgi:translation initiation factor IF-3
MKKTKQYKQAQTRINHQIRISPVRLVKEGKQVGIFPVDKARKMARDQGLDLVEVNPNVRPIVCAIMDYGKYRYQQSMKEKANKQKQKGTEIKEIRLSPKIADNDIATKVKAVCKFLSQGKKVQLNLVYRKRELSHKSEGFKVINKIIEEIQDVAKVENPPKIDGNRLTCRLEPITKK